MKKFLSSWCALIIIATGTAALAIGLSSSGSGGKRINATVNGLVAKGPAWSAAANYSSNSRYSHAVTYNGSTWAAIQNSNNQIPADNSVYWWKYIAQGATGSTGAAGATWHTGFDTPSGAGVTGADGDLFFDTSVEAKVFKKTSGTWGLIGNIRGPQGVQGFRGYTGAVGPQGATGATGSQGATGTVTASAGLVVAQRQYSSHSVELYQPSSVGSYKGTITVDNNLTTNPVVKITDTGITHNGIVLGTGGGGSNSFATKPRSVFTNMSTDKFYIPAAFAKHVLPLAGANKNLYVMAQTSSAHISTNSETGVIRQLGGITTTAGYTARIPKGSLYWFVAKEAGFWEAFKIIGSDITQYIADFAASLSISPTTKTFADTATGSSSATQAFTVSNTGNATGNLGTFALYSTNADQFTLSDNTCGATLSPSSSCTMNVAFTPTTAGAKSSNVGDGTLLAALIGTGTAALFSYTDNFNGSMSGNWTTITGSNPLSLASTYVTGSVVSAHNRVYYNSTTANNQYAQIKFVAVANHSGLLLRVNPSGTFYAFLIEDTSVTIKKCTNATTCVDKATFAYSVQSNDVMKFTAVGNLLTGYVNNLEKVNYTDNTSPYTTGFTGLSLYSNVGNADDAAGGDL